MKRVQSAQILNHLKTNKILLLSGPRQAGKEELANIALEDLGINALEINLQNKKKRRELEALSISEITEMFNQFPIVVIQEAQYLNNLQTIIEEVLSESIKATLLLLCSFEPVLDEVLSEVIELNHLNITIYPPSFYELAQEFGLPEIEKRLEQRLIFGNYPHVAKNEADAQELLTQLLDTVIVSDIGVNERINKTENLLRMLQVIAFSLGTPISYHEIAEKSGLDNETVERYVTLLEKAFVLINLDSYSTEKRYELKKSHLFFFVDNGIRNMLINNFNPPLVRNDMQALWLNWLISERIKWNTINLRKPHYWFWRTHTKQTIEFMEEFEGKFAGYKTAWEKKKKIKFPKMFSEYYPTVDLFTLNRSTYWGFLTKK